MSSERLNVLLVAPNIEYPGNTGGSVHLTEVSKRLAEHVDLTVACDCGSDFQKDGVSFRHVSGGRFDLFSLPRLWRLSAEADIIHSRADPFELAGPLVARLRNLPIIGEVNVNFLAYERKHTFRDLLYPLFHAIKWSWLRLVVKRLDQVVCVSNSIKDELVQQGFDPDKLVVVHNGGNPDRYNELDRDTSRERLGLDADAYIVLLMGELGPRHGLDTLIEADVEDATYLVIGGTDKYRDYVNRMKEQATSNFHFIDPVPYHDIKHYVAASDVVAAPYDESDNKHPFGFCPIKILDGMAAGKPVVASDRPWIREILSDNEGVVTNDITAGIIRLADDTVREEKGSNAKQRIEHRLSWRHTAEQLYGCYRKVSNR